MMDKIIYMLMVFLFLYFYLIQMIFCHFCASKKETRYLFLSCKHLSCLSCAFLNADFSSQQIQCCQQFTKIDESAMEAIIKSKRIFQPPHENKQNKSNDNQNKEQQNRNRVNPESYKQSMDKNELSGQLIEKESKNAIHGNQGQITNQNQNQEQELQNILLRQIERVKKIFDSQRQMLRQKQEIAIKDLECTYEKQIKQIKKPISSPEIQKISLCLSKKVSSLNMKDISQQSRVMGNLQNLKDLKDSRESYDHILKRLQTNQQRMKQKIQRHLEVPY